MKHMIILRGLPGSGKSTFAKELCEKDQSFKRVNRDDLRKMIGHYIYSAESEKLIVELENQAIKTILKNNNNVIVDDTNLVSTVKFHNIAKSIGDVMVTHKCFKVDVSICLQRNSKRPDDTRVPDEVILDMAKKFKSNKIHDSKTYYESQSITTQKIVQDENLPKAILCDLDGTLALIGDRSPYDASECDIKDMPNWPVIKTVLAMHAQGIKVIFMSGRDSKYREQTIRFIEKYCIQIPYQLYMRKTDDIRKDSIIKQELFDEHIRGKYNIIFALDDRDQIVRFWRSIGLTCFQVNYGDF